MGPLRIHTRESAQGEQQQTERHHACPDGVVRGGIQFVLWCIEVVMNPLR